jgi:hypothetical protein
VQAPLPASVMAKMGLLPDSMLTRTRPPHLLPPCSASLSSTEQPEAPAPTVSFAAQAKFNSFYSSAALPVSAMNATSYQLHLMRLCSRRHGRAVVGLFQAQQHTGVNYK